MQYMIIRKADADTEAEVMPGEELLAAMGRYNEEMVAAGIMRAGEGLKPSRDGVRVRFAGGKATVIDGPFAESKELIAGFSVVEVGSRQEALDWVKRWPAQDAGGQARLEVREMGCDASRAIGSSLALAPPRSPGKQRYMILLLTDADSEAQLSPDATRLAAMAQSNAQSIKAGVMLAGEGLQPSATGFRVHFAKGKPMVIDGPFAEAKELIAGFWMIQTASLDEAIDWVKHYPFPRDAARGFAVEIRRVYEAEDFGVEFTPELREAEDRMREQIRTQEQRRQAR